MIFAHFLFEFAFGILELIAHMAMLTMTVHWLRVVVLGLLDQEILEDRELL